MDAHSGLRCNSVGPKECTYIYIIYSVLVQSVRQRGRFIRLPECRDPDPLTISQPATQADILTRPGAIYEPILPDRRTQPCTDAFVNTIAHTHTPTHGSERKYVLL